LSIKIAHECPKSIFNEVEAKTDYSYALVHLFEEDQQYYDQFTRIRDEGGEIILDNSLFELETPFDSDRFFYWVEKLKPTWYIIPDALEDKNLTIANCLDWHKKYKTDCKSIAVVQGKTYEEVVECYQAIEPLVDKVAISFDYSFFKEWFPHQFTKYHQYVLGRQALLHKMVNDKVINLNKPHHLLGCGLPQEFASYQSLYPWIDSIDTSNPVVAGMKGIRYNGMRGLEDKPSQKLYTMINSDVTEEQKANIFYNIDMFRKIVRG